MENEIIQRVEALEKQVAKKKKDGWEKLQALTPVLIPVTIALVGWYFTNEHNKNQLELQRINSDNQLQVALINSNVGQSELIKDFMQHLTSRDTAIRNIAIEAILYAAPNPGKRIVDILAASGDVKTREQATDALEVKRKDLVANLFSFQKSNRLTAANEISINWTSDNMLLEELISKSNDCLSNKDITSDCDNGLYNTIIVMNNFSKELLHNHRQEILSLIKRIPPSSTLTLAQGNQLEKKMR